MLNTGVDIPEVCNLVFARPVYSPIEFHQMIGRGTRPDQTCKHKDWLPNGKKEKFRIFDCWEVFDYFKLHPQGVEPGTSESYPSKIFLERLKQLTIYRQKGDKDNFEKTKEKIEDDIHSLPRDSIGIREKEPDIKSALDPRLWQRVGPDPIEFLRTRIAPLMKHQTGVGLKESKFLLSCVQLSTSMLEGDTEDINRYKLRIAHSLSCLPTEIEDVREKEELLDKYLSQSFWQEPSIEDIESISKDFTPLMKYKRDAPRTKIVLDIDDTIEKRGLMVEYGPANAPKHDFAKNYIEKVEERVRALAEGHPTMIKIKSDQKLTEEDLLHLEKTLNSPDLYISEETLRKAYQQGNATLVKFIKKIIGLYEFPDPDKEIERAFQTYLVENNKQYSADQIRFIMAIQSVFRSKKHIEMSDFYEPPFTGFGSKSPIPMFDEEELETFVGICSELEKELFATEA
jgi:type I restriction enzyme R subunit